MLKNSCDRITKSASLIISSAYKSLNKSPRGDDFDYKIMLLKRNKKMRVAANFHVFPGGKIDDIDGSLNWLDVFFNSNQLESIRSEPSLVLSRFFKCLISRNSIGSLIKDEPNELKSNLPFEVSYRLCAIRETFEETGILLARERGTHNATETTPSRLLMTDYYKNFELQDKIKYWHEDVLKDSSKFIDMFIKLNLVPNIFGLHEWANWITPVQEKARFNAFFFICYLNEIPDNKYMLVNDHEIESLEV